MAKSGEKYSPNGIKTPAIVAVASVHKNKNVCFIQVSKEGAARSSSKYIEIEFRLKLLNHKPQAKIKRAVCD